MSESFKVVLIGETGVGKTSIITQFMDQTFQEDQQSTTGGTYSTKSVIYNGNKELKFEIWDTAGQERYRALTKMFYKDAGAAVLVYDITRKESFEELKSYWAQQIKETSPEGIILVVVGNKSDLENEAVDEEDARKFADELGALYLRASAKNSCGINNIFEEIAKKHTGSEDVKIKADDGDQVPVEEDKKDNKDVVKITNKKEDRKEKKKGGFC
jgi:small GTP-binding protein